METMELYTQPSTVQWQTFAATGKVGGSLSSTMAVVHTTLIQPC